MKRRGFTLIELLVVIAIIAILIGLLIPAVQKVRDTAQRMTCQNNLHNLAVAVHNYENGTQYFPPGLTQNPSPFRGVTFFVHLLPHIEQGNIYNAWDMTNLATNSAGATPLTGNVIPTLLCPSDSFTATSFTLPVSSGSTVAYAGVYAVTSYAGNHGTRSYYPPDSQANGIFFSTGPSSSPASNQLPVRLQDITDGKSSTILMGEKFHRDPNFDLIPSGSRSTLLMHQWACWAWTGGFKGTGHVMASSAVPINYTVPVGGGSSGGYNAQDLRLNAWGSGHTGGANFVMCDGSTRFISDRIPQATLQNLSTRAGNEVVQDTF